MSRRRTSWEPRWPPFSTDCPFGLLMDSQVESIPVIGHTPRRTTSLSLLIVVLAVLALSGCGGDRAAAKGEDPKQVD